MSINQKIYLIVAVMLLIVVFLFLFVIKPLFLEIRKTSALATESRDKLLSFERIDKGYLEQAEDDYRNINENINLIKRQSVDGNEAVRFFEALELLASSTYNKLEINAVDFPVLTLSLTGAFSDFMKFLGWLENGDYFINIDSISIKRLSNKEAPEEVQNNVTKTTLKISVYLKETNESQENH